jgi:hypothetical protein
VTARAVDRAFDYAVPAELDGRVSRGSVVEVELGTRRVRGVVTALPGAGDVSALKPLVDVVGDVPVRLLELAEWIAATYASTLARALALVTPPAAEARPPDPWVRVLSGEGATARQAEILAHAGLAPVPLADLVAAAGTTRETLRRMRDRGLVALEAMPPAPRTDVRVELTAAQEAAVAACVEVLEGGGGDVLVHGVTGSGKTEIYLNAIDAALTTAAMLTVAYPHNCAIGGDMLALVRDPDGDVTFINGSGRALLATDVDAVRREHDVMPERGPIPITVPGMVDGWATLATKGAALAWEHHLGLAQSAAAEGVRVAPGLAAAIAYIAPSLDGYPELAAIICPGGQPLRVGQTMRQPELARTLGAIAEAGSAALYNGALSDVFCAGLNTAGVPISRDDLSGHHAQETPPLTLDIGEWTLYTAPPNSQAYLVLRLLAKTRESGYAGAAEDR